MANPLPHAPQWQPMSDMPKDGTKVLMYDGFDCVVAYCNFATAEFYTESLCCEPFTHWMPLPDPPSPPKESR